jgi:uncharacterized membrane protein
MINKSFAIGFLVSIPISTLFSSIFLYFYHKNHAKRKIEDIARFRMKL